MLLTLVQVTRRMNSPTVPITAKIVVVSPGGAGRDARTGDVSAVYVSPPPPRRGPPIRCATDGRLSRASALGRRRAPSWAATGATAAFARSGETPGRSRAT